MPSSGGQTCALDRKSTRLNSSHGSISYAAFCLKKKKKLYELLCEKVTGTGRIEWSTLTKESNRMEAIQMCILLLFLALFFLINRGPTEETPLSYTAVLQF